MIFAQQVSLLLSSLVECSFSTFLGYYLEEVPTK